MEHIALCPTCRTTLKELRETEEMRRQLRPAFSWLHRLIPKFPVSFFASWREALAVRLRPRRSAFLIPAYAVATLLLLTLTLHFLLPRSPQGLEVAVRPPEARPPSPPTKASGQPPEEDRRDVKVAVKPVEPGAIKLPSSTSGAAPQERAPARTIPPPSPGDKGQQPPDQRRQAPTQKHGPERIRLAANLFVEDGVLHEGAERLPDWTLAHVSALQQASPSRLMGGQHVPLITLVNPNPGNRGLVETTPTFAWEPVEGAERYEVELERVPQAVDEEPTPVPLTVDGATAQVSPEAPLTEGRTYRLRIRPVRPTDPEALEISPPEPDSVFAFKTLTETEVEQVQWARQNRGKAPITSAAVLYNLEMFADAAEELDRWPADPQTARWQETIKSALEQRLSDPGS